MPSWSRCARRLARVRWSPLHRLPRRRLHVLVAEDSRVNQHLVTRMLEKAGHATVVAGNGREAVAAVERQAFDLVLMDVQMPEMDGLAATGAIRRREASGDRRLPIVALTAHATARDREICLAAGMDAYLSKPVKREDLLAMLDRMAAQAPAPAAFNAAAALRYTGDDEVLLRELLVVFLEDAPGHLEAVREAVEHGNAAGLQSAAHRLKGSLRALGAIAPASLAERLEHCGAQARLAETASLLAGLTTEVDRLQVDIRQWCATPAPAAVSEA